MSRISLASLRGRGKSAALAESDQPVRYAAKGKSRSMKRTIPQNKSIIDRNCDVRVDGVTLNYLFIQRSHVKPHSTINATLKVRLPLI